MIVGARRFQPRTSVRSGAAAARLDGPDGGLVHARLACAGEPDRVVVLADDDDLVARRR